MEDVIQYKKTSSDDKENWVTNYTLTKEQVAQLIRNKTDRAKIYRQTKDERFFAEE